MRRIIMTLFISLVSVVMLFASQSSEVRVPGMLTTKTMEVLQTKYCSFVVLSNISNPYL